MERFNDLVFKPAIAPNKAIRERGTSEMSGPALLFQAENRPGPGFTAIYTEKGGACPLR